MYSDPIVVKTKLPSHPALPKIMGRGRKPGFGKYRNVVMRMKIGDSIWDLTKTQCDGVKNSAYKCGMKVATRRIAMTDKYMVMRTA